MSIADGARLRVSVCDQGHGLTAAALSRAGEPFYTTKDTGRGMGLGLFLARVFAERFGGSLSLESDRGTTATLDLPVARNGADARMTDARTLLVVDDDEAVPRSPGRARLRARGLMRRAPAITSRRCSPPAATARSSP